MGDGRAIVSRHAAIIERARLLREYGWLPGQRYVSQIAGMNSRLDELQAAILRVRLPLLASENATRVRLAALYDALLPVALKRPTVAHGATHVFHLYVVRTDAESGLRDRLRAELGRLGIATAIHYPVPIHLQPAYVGGSIRSHDLGVTEQVVRQILSLPMHPYLAEQQVETVARTLAALLP
jgi:dTDP-4-amino-4,6-dideoxygalactose transaminase